MSKVAVVYWSMTGNTEAMAKELASAADTEAIESSEFSADMCDQYDAFAFGCPAMGDEVLEEDEFEPFFTEAEKKLSGVPVGLFGSYGWGSGAWMEAWVERTKAAGAKLVSDGVIVENAPDDDGVKACEDLGEAVAKAL